MLHPRSIAVFVLNGTNNGIAAMSMAFVEDRESHERVVQELVIEGMAFIWIATAGIKDVYVSKGPECCPFALGGRVGGFYATLLIPIGFLTGDVPPLVRPDRGPLIESFVRVAGTPA